MKKGNTLQRLSERDSNLSNQGCGKKPGFHGRDPVTLRGSRVHANSPEWFNHSKRKHATENTYGKLETSFL